MVSFARIGSRCAVLVALLAGCAEQPAPSQGNAQLGIARFVQQDSAQKTVVIGLDDNGNEVGRLELTRGRFTLSPFYAQDHDTPDIDGRKLLVDVKGQNMTFETEGYGPLMSLPAHPAEEWAIAAFTVDPHVKAVLDKWQLGFKTPGAALEDEATYKWAGMITGEPGQTLNCTGQASCGTVQNKTIGMCGGSNGLPTDAYRVKQIAGCDQTAVGGWLPGGDQYKVIQCCPNASTPFAAYKTCPLSGTTSECGTSNTACVGCQSYNNLTSCSISMSSYSGNGAYCNGTTRDIANQSVTGGSSGSSCPPGQTLCGSSCIDPQNLQNDPYNCGSCGNICPQIDATHGCYMGHCGLIPT